MNRKRDGWMDGWTDRWMDKGKLMEEIVGQFCLAHISPFNLLLRSDWHPGRIIHYQFSQISRCTISNPCNLSLNFSLLSERENYMHLKRCKPKTICYRMVHTIENCGALGCPSLECFSSQSWISRHSIILSSLKVEIGTLILSDLRRDHFKMHYLFFLPIYFSPAADLLLTTRINKAIPVQCYLEIPWGKHPSSLFTSYALPIAIWHSWEKHSATI